MIEYTFDCVYPSSIMQINAFLVARSLFAGKKLKLYPRNTWRSSLSRFSTCTTSAPSPLKTPNFSVQLTETTAVLAPHLLAAPPASSYPLFLTVQQPWWPHVPSSSAGTRLFPSQSSIQAIKSVHTRVHADPSSNWMTRTFQWGYLGDKVNTNTYSIRYYVPNM